MSKPQFKADASPPLRLYLLLTALLLLSLLLCLNIGAVALDWPLLWQQLNTELAGQQQQILLELRLPRVLLGALAGAALALCGAILQNISRNQLADPYLFGIVSGAAFGATLATVFLPQYSIALPLAAFAGAMLAVTLVVLLASVARWQQIESFVLAGVAISFLFSALGSALLYMGDAFAANRIMFWLMGSLARAEMTAVWIITPVLLLTLSFVWLWRRQLSALSWSDDTAKSLGVAVNPLRLALLVCTAALTATVVAYCGGIGFVGLMVPHLIRLLFGVNPLVLLFGSTLLGASFLLWVDAAARTILPNQEIPLGVLTSALGSVFFLLILSRRRRF